VWRLPFIKRIDFARARQLDRLGRRRMAVLGGHESIGRDIDTFRIGDRAYLLLRSHQHRHDHSAFRRLERTEQRIAVAGMHDRAAHGRKSFATPPQVREAVVAPQDDLRRRDVRIGDRFGRRGHNRRALDQRHVVLVDATAVKLDPTVGGKLRPRGHGRCQHVADGD
jgi:hypothetical protein